MALSLEQINGKYVTPVIAIATAVMAFYYSQLNSKVDLQSKQIATQLSQLSLKEKEVDVTIKEEDFKRELRFKLFTEVKEAIQKRDPQVQAVVKEFVIQMLSDDDAFKNSLLQAFLVSPLVNDSIKQGLYRNLRHAQEFRALQSAQLVPNAESKAKIRVDVFYVEGTEAASLQVVKDITATLISNTEYSVRYRMLPKMINAGETYNIYRNEIRYEKSREADAQKILSILKDKKLVTELPVLNLVGNLPSPGYISVFIHDK